MADVYIVYASENVKLAERIFELLSQQWNVWWDKKIVGRFRHVIESELPKSGCIIAINSIIAREKDTFAEELRLGQKHNIQILPIRLDNADLPYPFGAYSYVDMHGWSGEPDHCGFIELKSRLASVVAPRDKPKRPKEIAHGRLRLPSIFMSVSSYETRLKPIKALKALCAFRTPTILVSAYDLANEPKPHVLLEILEKYRLNGGYVLIDSGIYEAYRFRDNTWDEKRLMEVLDKAPYDMAFSFDKLKPGGDCNRYIENVIKRVKKHQDISLKPIIPIIHVPKSTQGIKEIPRIVRDISETLGPPIIAIPERELGAGMVARARTIRNIRTELNKLPSYQPIHILGTGHPWSIAILAAAGADTFDGLEWCRYTIDHDAEVINHFHHFDLLSDIKGDRIGFFGKIAYHNLEYYKMLGSIMHDMFTLDSVESFVRGILSKRAFNRLKYEFPELFK